MTKKILITLGVALTVFLMFLVSVNIDTVFSLDIFINPTGGLIRSPILIFCVSLIGLYWLVRIYLPKRFKSNKRNDP